MLKLIKKQFVSIAVSLLGYAPSFVASPLLKKADSLFAAQRFSESRELYSESFNVQKKTSKSDLLKLAFMEEGRDNAVLAIYYLHQFYLFQPEKRCLNRKSRRWPTRNKFQGYSIMKLTTPTSFTAPMDHWSRKVYSEWPLPCSSFLPTGKSKGYRWGFSVFTLLFLAASAYFFNFSLPYKRAIVVSDEKIFMMSGPSAGSSVVAMLDKGHRLEWTGEEDIWYEVKWNEKKAGSKKPDCSFSCNHSQRTNRRYRYESVCLTLTHRILKYTVPSDEIAALEKLLTIEQAEANLLIFRSKFWKHH